MLFRSLLRIFLMTRMLVQGAKTKSDFLVENLETVEPAYALFEGDMYAGTLPIHNDDANGEIMFWLFDPSAPTVDDSMVIWLNGGPGCSSFLAGLMLENSPVMVTPHPAGYCCMTPDEPLAYNPYAWTNATAMLYVEQPVGVGFSNGGKEPNNEEDVARDMYGFLVNFYKVFTDFQPKRLFIVGESYAGMYVPSIARYIHLETTQFRKGKVSGRVDMHLSGIALGNGWVDPEIQGPATIDYGYWHGLIDSYTRDALHKEWQHCMESPRKEKEPSPFHKFNPPDDCGMMGAILTAAGADQKWPGMETPYMGLNGYDVSSWDNYNEFILKETNNTIIRFFNNPKVKEMLHAPPDIDWQGCIPGAGRRRLLSTRNLMLDNDEPNSTVPYMAELLDAGVPVLVYNGDLDLTTCAQGSEAALNGMDWHGAQGWPQAERALWISNNRSAGYAKEHEDLSFVVVYNSGHLVPMNQPAVALDLITRFLQRRSFADYVLPSFRNNLNGSTSEKQDTPPTRHDWSFFMKGFLLGLISGLLMVAVTLYTTRRLRGRRFREYEEISSAGVEIE